MRIMDIKYLGYGLGIGLLVASLVFGGIFFVSTRNAAASNSLFGVQDTPTASSLAQPGVPLSMGAASTSTEFPDPMITFMPTPTMLPVGPSPTPLPSPTATLTPTEMMIANGKITFTGPLTREQIINLYDGSQHFIAPTLAEAKQMSVLINHVRFSDPTTTCGPLSLAVLQQARLISPDVVPHSFFLLDPSIKKDRELLQTVFTADRYSDTRYHIRLDKFDWKTNPLMPGDFLYIYSGMEGNFDHMLVVNRVDAAGRAYSVTNFGTQQGFIIDEVMLYDPNDPNVGIFAQWTRAPKQILGSTGFSGFEVWRLK